MNVILKVFIVIYLCFSLFACSDGKSKEDQVRQFIDTAKNAVEERSYVDLAQLIHKDYADHKAMDKSQLVSFTGRYFLTHKNIHLFTKIDEMLFYSENKVKVTLYVAMAGNVISDASLLLSLRAKVYKFELQLVKDDLWLLQLANWQKSSVKEMMRSINTSVETIQ